MIAILDLGRFDFKSSILTLNYRLDYTSHTQFYVLFYGLLDYRYVFSVCLIFS